MKFNQMPRYIMRKHVINKILKSISCDGKDLLEIGYGAGDIFTLYEKFNLNVYGYDYSEVAYNYAKSNVKANRVELYKELSDIGDKKFDIVAAYEVLEHIKDDYEAIEQWKNYLKPNGKLIISVPANPKKWGANDVYSGHYKRYIKSELIDLLNRANMSLYCLYTYDFPSSIILDPLRDYEANKKLKKIDNSSDKDQLTKISGIDRSQKKVYVLLSNKYLMYPLLKFQELFYRTDLGSAYILMANNYKK